MIRRLLVLSVLVLPLAPALADARPAPATVTQVREVFSPDGSISRVRVTLPAAAKDAPVSRAAAATVVPLQVSGPSDRALDLTVVGDGYTKGERETFLRHARGKVAELFSVEPYKSYRGAFNVWAVVVVSPQPGVDNDPSLGVSRSTALDMGFWCGGTERLLCADTAKAKAAASAAPATDMVLALANSTMYGGAGGDIATSSGGNARAGQIVVHELGHSIGDLADEYDSAYVGGIPAVDAPEANASVFPSQAMEAAQLKWWRWLGQATPDGGRIGTFMGARYNPVVYYRPSESSIMRVLGKPFNLVGREGMVLGFYRLSKPLLTATETARSGRSLSVTTARPATCVVTWTVDGKPAGRGTSLSLKGVRKGATVVATVTDRTPWVLPSAERDRLLTATRTWTVG